MHGGDWSSFKVMDSVSTMLPENSLLMREGVQMTIVASEIVPGIAYSSRLKTNCQQMFASSMSCLMQNLTAPYSLVRLHLLLTNLCRPSPLLTLILRESLPLSKTINSTNDNYLETRCIGMQGTHCISDSAIGVVVATSDDTVFGPIAKLTNEPKTGMTTLEREIFDFVLIIVSNMLTMIIVVIVVW